MGLGRMRWNFDRVIDGSGVKRDRQTRCGRSYPGMTCRFFTVSGVGSSRARAWRQGQTGAAAATPPVKRICRLSCQDMWPFSSAWRIKRRSISISIIINTIIDRSSATGQEEKYDALRVVSFFLICLSHLVLINCKIVKNNDNPPFPPLLFVISK
ncbi:hypothetical protein M752DRAFT_330519 [Aspergillus phoenicis ATCC 13157]|uniref:Uncharacterized protein n=1 Tax=Aspergillus phoenicis ATCC 13157 TaxID=1353007 RepID=A0A370P5Q9_ASPPH|nr:hypothetical protein M752DRAFT_330519 [Aspergillus phoenicis ATCC 13157]